MTEAGWAALQRHLLMRYADFKKRLTRHFGSADRATEALHDTWLRLERGGKLSAVRNPDTYLYSMAINIAANNRRAENRRLTVADVDALLEIADDAPDAANVLEARAELDVLVSIIGELRSASRRYCWPHVSRVRPGGRLPCGSACPNALCSASCRQLTTIAPRVSKK